MLRTNLNFLALITQLYDEQDRKEEITLKTYTKGNLLLKQGMILPRVLFIKTGIVKCFLSEENGKDFIVEFLGSGEVAGELEVIRDIPCLCSVEAVTDVEVYALRVPYFRSLLDNNTSFSRLLINELAERLVNTSTRSSAQQLFTIEIGLRKILGLQSRLGIDLSKDDMAAYLGVTPRSLNRALKNLRKDNGS
ncbi:Crp/Fnr family transcriptional regulator [Flavihumibacter solisilvae]|uniref:Crp/Fnr family transcriptional regulator n=1 Tax=Flavihumibacter solisilvae TaxID=1349421 RepID=A0A0C1L0A1_9BACT|nr:Crp/Fnr family transcriptional regulator [Flavihumibacter solisilvae]KIC93407.1 Crp/Fnr family transcriptional regulator [Flavihumibacter solisilvae]